MPSKKRRYTILGAGEHYKVELDPRKYYIGRPPEAQTIDTARRHLVPRVERVLREIEELPSSVRLSEAVIELRLGERFSAKSYHPVELLKASGLSVRGVGTWTSSTKRLPKRKGEKKAEEKLVPNRLLYVSGNTSHLRRLVNAIATGDGNKVDGDVVKLEDVRLPSKEDRLRLTPKDKAKKVAVEIVLFDWTDRLLREALSKIKTLFRENGVPDDDVRVRSYENGPTFVAAVVPRSTANALGEFNFLRSARTLPRVGLSDALVRRAFTAKTAPVVTSVAELPTIAVFDGGYSSGDPLLDPYVHCDSLTPKAATTELLEHGSMVSSAAIYGPFELSGAIPAPRCNVAHFRVLPDAKNDHLELWGVIDAIEGSIPKLPAEVRVVNLSLGPEAPVDDAVPSRFTYAIDQLVRQHGKLFVTAAGNWGHKPGDERVQPPADSVNNLAVGAFREDAKGGPEYAHYSSRGRGRAGAVVKPDVVEFGGCAARPFYACVTPGHLAGVTGTSFASPVVAALLAHLAGEVDAPTPLSAEALRALLIHGATKIPGATQIEVGFGRAPRNVEQILECSDKRVSVLYQGLLSPRQGWKLPFLLPVGFDGNGNVTFSWTMAFSPDVMPSAPDEYTMGGIEVGFRPHADIFSYSPPKGSDEKPRDVDVEIDWQTAEELDLDGWRRSQLPVVDSRSSAKTEIALRVSEGKWETVLVDSRRKRSTSVSEPMVTLHVHGRGDWNRRDPRLQARYAAVLTVEAPKYVGDLYDEVVNLYTKVGPLSVRDHIRAARV
jgi:hypothetical protein